MHKDCREQIKEKIFYLPSDQGSTNLFYYPENIVCLLEAIAVLIRFLILISVTMWEFVPRKHKFHY